MISNYRIRLCAWVTVGVFLVALVGVAVYFSTHAVKNTHKGSNPVLGKYKHAAVASDVTQCSQIGRYSNSSYEVTFYSVDNIVS